MAPDKGPRPVDFDQNQAADHQRTSYMDRFRRPAFARIAATVALLGAGGALAEVVAHSGETSAVATADGTNAVNNVPVLVSSQSEALTNCDSLQSANAAADATHYNSDAFLPKTPVTTAEGAKQYVFNLFSEKGPLAGQGDLESLAAMMATVYNAGHQGGVENASYDYLAEFNKQMGKYNQPDRQAARKQAIADCKNLVGTLVQDVGYNNDWADPGENITLFAANRDKDNNYIDGASLERGVTNTTLRGIEFRFRSTSKGENGYLSILISTNSKGVWNGGIYIKGLSLQQFNGTSTVQRGKNPVHNQHQNAHPSTNGQPNAQPSPNGTPTSSTFNGKVLMRSSGTVTARGFSGGTFGSSNNNAESNRPGSTPEKGGSHGHRPGSQNSFGTHGPGGPGPGTTTPETTPTPPPVTTTETTPPPPPPTTTTETTPPPPPPTTTSQKPGSPGQPGA